MKRTRNAFTLVEVLIAAALGSVVIGGGMMLYVQGNKMFYSTTEHSSFRSEALLLLETAANDFDQLQVSAGANPETGNWSLLQPYRIIKSPKFTQKITAMQLNPKTGKEEEIEVEAGDGVSFFRFHHIAMGAPTADLPLGKPKMIGRKVVYETVDIDPSDPSKGKNLLRNGKRVNQIPLASVIFHKEPPIVAAEQVQGSPHALITMTVVPQGGLFGNMKREALLKLEEKGSIIARTFHLVGYESFYTSVLYSGLQKGKGSITGLDDLTKAVVSDATKTSPELTKKVAASASKTSQTYSIDAEVFVLDETTFVDETAGKDPGWLSVPAVPGRDVGSGGEGWEDDGRGGSGSGSGSGGSGSAGSRGSSG